MSRIATLTAEYEQATAAVKNIERAAVDAGRDLTETEEAESNVLAERAAELSEAIRKEGARLDQAQEVAAIMAKHSTGTVERAADNKEAENFAEFVQRAEQVSTDGILPVAIVGNLISLYDEARPVFNSFAQRQFPPRGMTFERPNISQHVAVDQQDDEFDPIATQEMTLATEVVYKRTAGGYIDLSEQAIDWNDPAALEAVVQDFTRVYANRTEIEARAFISKVASASAGWVDTDVNDVSSSLIDAMIAVEGETFGNANTVWVDRATWGGIAKSFNTTTDTSGLVLVKQALEAYGVSPNFVVGRFASPTLIVGDNTLIEAYEQYKGMVSIPQPEVLGQRVAVRGYYGFWAHGTQQVDNQTANVTGVAKGFRRLI